MSKYFQCEYIKYFFFNFMINYCTVTGNSEGLLGVWNDDMNDDLLSSSGQTIPVNSSSQEIFTSFGETCEN